MYARQWGKGHHMVEMVALKLMMRFLSGNSRFYKNQKWLMVQFQASQGRLLHVTFEVKHCMDK